MKRNSIVTGMTLLVAVLAAGQVLAAARAGRPAAGLLVQPGVESVMVQAVQGAQGQQQLSYALPAPEVRVLAAGPAAGRHRLVLGNAESVGAPGLPMLPVVPCWIVVPQGHVVARVVVTPGALRALDGVFALEQGQTPYPLSQPGKARVTAPDAAVFGSDEAYPGRLFDQGDVQKKQGVSMLGLTLHPAVYRPKSGRLAVYETLTVEVFTEPAAVQAQESVAFRPAAVAAVAQLADNPAVSATYRVARVLAPNAVAVGPQAGPWPALPCNGAVSYDYVAITKQSFRDSAATPSLSDLIDLKQARGVTATIVTVEDILQTYAGKDNAGKVRAFIRDAYNVWNVKFILMAGDTGVVPFRYLWCQAYEGGDIDTIPSDLYFQALDGDFDGDGDGVYGEPNDNVDLLSEVAIGRASAESEAEMSNWVFKTLDYERSSDKEAYIKDVLLVGEHLGFGGVSEYATASMEEIRLGSNAHGYQTLGFAFTNNVVWGTNTLYDSPTFTWSTADIVNAMNSETHGVYNHLGHCNESYAMKMVNGDADGLTNTRFSFIYSQGCIPGAFDRDCIAEHFTTSTRNGMFAVVMNARFGWGSGNSTDGPSQRFNRPFWHDYFQFKQSQLGPMNAYAHEFNAANINGSCIRWVFYESNLLGDPEIAIKGYGLVSTLELDRKAYRSDGLVRVKVNDPSVDPASMQVPVGIATTNVPFAPARWSETNTPLYSVDGARIFTNAFQLVSGATAVEGDTLMAWYVDAKTNRSEVTVPIDDTPPVISGVTVANMTEDGGTVTWFTDEPANSFVIVSNSVPLAGGALVGSAAYVETPVMVAGQMLYPHAVVLTALQPLTAYRVGVVSFDYAGNTNTYPASLNDPNPDNYPILITQQRVATYKNGLDDGPEGWSVTNVGNVACWQYGKPTYRPTEPVTGERCWGTVLDGRYPNLANASLISPPIHVTTAARLSFWSWHEIMATELEGEYRDAGFIELYDGSGWHNVTSNSDLFAGSTTVQGASVGWQQVNIDISRFSNTVIRLRFRLETDAAVTASGWYIDDLEVSHVPAPGLYLVDYRVDDAAGGDGDGYAEPGESFKLGLKLFNSSPYDTYTNVTGEVGSTTPGVTPASLGTVPVNYGTIRPGDGVWCLAPITTRVDASVPDNSVAHFIQGVHDRMQKQWTQEFDLPIGTRLTITGRVTAQATGLPVAGAMVWGRLPDNTVLTTQTSADGTYALHGNLPGQATRVRAGQPGVFSPTPAVSVMPPATGVDFALAGVAILEVVPPTVTMTVPMGGRTSAPLTLLNTDAAANLALTYETWVEYLGLASNWLAVTPPTGTVAVGGNAVLNLAADARSLAAYTYQAIIHIDSNDLGGRPYDVPVSLVVEDAPTLGIRQVAVINDNDGDGYLEPGEQGDLVIRLYNYGTVPAFGVTGLVSSLSAAVNVLAAAAQWPEIPSFNAVDAIVLPRVDAIAAAAGAPMQLDIRDANQIAWSLSFALPITNRWTLSGQVRQADTTPVVGAEVRAQGANGTQFATTDVLGNYAINGLLGGSYRVLAIPPLPNNAPAASNVVLTADLAGIDFVVGEWGLVVSPTAIASMVEEGREGHTPLTVRNTGTLPGEVFFDVKHKDGVTQAGAPQAVPLYNFAALAPQSLARGQMIVRFKTGQSRGEGLAALRARGLRVLRVFKHVPAAIVAYPPAQDADALANQLRAERSIAYVEPNFKISLYRSPNDPLLPEQYGLHNERQTGGTLGADIDAPEAWETSVGDTNVIVAVIDTGVDILHDDLAANIWHNPGEQPGDANGDGFPGVLGVDDDGDAAASLESDVTDGIDNDGDGLVDETGIDFLDEDVMRMDINANGIPLVGTNGIFECRFIGGQWWDRWTNVVGNVTNVTVADDDIVDVLAAVTDDDENGYPDDLTGWNFVGFSNDVSDDVGHGTHVAGTIGAVTDNGVGVAGVAWKVRIMPCKIFAAAGGGDETLGAAIAALEYAVDKGARVSNNSYGWTAQFQYGLFYEAIRYAMTNGHTMVCASGNDGADNDQYPHYPSSYDLPNVVSVAATDHNDKLATFSCYGATTVDLAAPGVDILSTIPDGFQLRAGQPGRFAGSYEIMSGTSMASPHVAGVAALLRAVAPWATPEMITRALYDGARRDPALQGQCVTGAHLDARGALAVLSAFWVKIAPASITVAAGRSATVDVTLNAGAHLTPGVYSAEIYVRQGLAYQTVPVSLTVGVAPVPQLLDLVVDDRVGLAPRNDGDGFAEPGETVDLFLRLANTGSALLLDPVGTVATAKPGVTISDATLAWNGLGNDDRELSQDPVRVALGPAVVGVVPFKMTLTDAEARRWTNLVFNLDVANRNSVAGTVRTGSGRLLAGVPVEYWGVSAGRVTTDAAGAYRIDGLPDGAVKVRAIPDSYARPGVRTNVLVAANGRADFVVGLPLVAFSTNQVTVNLHWNMSTTTTVTIANAAVTNFNYRIRTLPRNRVALIADGQALNGLEGVLRGMGLDVTSYTNNFDVVPVYDPMMARWTLVDTVHYSGDDEIVFGYDLIVADLSGENQAGRLLLATEWAVLDAYTKRGGKLIVTGVNPLTRPDDALMLELVGAQTLDRADQKVVLASVTEVVPEASFSAVGVGDKLKGQSLVYDLALPGANPDVDVYVRAETAAKVMRRQVPGGGTVCLWSGNDGTEWNARGAWQDLFKDLVRNELAGSVSWLSVSDTVGTLSRSAVNNKLVFNTARDLPEGTYQATLLVEGNYTNGENEAIQVMLNVAAPTVRVASASGVKDWLDRPLAGNGGDTASLLQLIYAGPDGVIDPPLGNGQTTGDDQVLEVYPMGDPSARVGDGYEQQPNFGQFSQIFRHDLAVGAVVYVRAWDAASFENSIAYGDSPRYVLSNIYGETHDFGPWSVTQVIGYPTGRGEVPRDANGDTIPDGYCVLYGLDPRAPIQPLPSVGTPSQWFGLEGPEPGYLSYPRGLFHSTNFVFVFVLDSGNNRIQVFNRATSALVSVFGGPGSGAGQFSQPDGMAADPRAGRYRFAVADTGNHRVQTFTFDPATGAIAVESQFGRYGAADGQFNTPRGVAISPLGYYYVADTLNNRLQVFTAAGAFNRKLGDLGTQSGYFNQPEGVGVDRLGLVYVADTQNHRVQVFDNGLRFLGQLGTTGSAGTDTTQLNYPRDVQVGVDGRIFVLDSLNYRVQIFNRLRQYVGTLGSFGEQPGQLKLAFAVNPVANSSQVYVADTYNHRIQLIDTAVDGDRDGMDDLWESRNGLNNLDGFDWASDLDGDGVSAIGEFRLQINPLLLDTDGDETSDGLELLLGWNPADPQYGLLRVTGFRATDPLGVIVRYMTEAGGTYRVESSPELLAPAWSLEPASELTVSVSGIRAYTNAPAAPRVKYYRAVRVR